MATAVWAGPNLAVAEPAAAAALLLGALWVTVQVLPRLRRLGPVSDPSRFDRPEFIGDAVEEGDLGRQTIISTINGLESEVFGARRVPLTLEDERDLARAPASEFRAWVNARLDALERAT